VVSVQTGVAAVTEFLERKGIPYEVVEHERTETAVAEARAAGVPAADVAKTIVLRDEEGLRLAVIPASERLDMHKLRQALASRGLRLVTEREMANELDEFEVGAVPPFGSMFDALELVDERLLEHPGRPARCGAGRRRARGRYLRGLSAVAGSAGVREGALGLLGGNHRDGQAERLDPMW
jgi:Ala-tRNA(Pro) deacylase